jgi:hypothetical protein
MLSTLSATDTRGLCSYIIHVSICLHIIHMSICLMIVECEVSTSSTAGIKVVDTPSRHRSKYKTAVSNTVGPAMHLYALCWDNSVPTDALSPQLATLLARQRSYTRSVEIIPYLRTLMLTLNTQILVAIYQFRCRMSNTKVSPRLTTPDGPVFVSSALCRENFYTNGMKSCLDGHIECLTLYWAST